MSVELAKLLNKLGLNVTYDGDKQKVCIERNRKKAAMKAAK